MVHDAVSVLVVTSIICHSEQSCQCYHIRVTNQFNPLSSVIIHLLIFVLSHVTSPHSFCRVALTYSTVEIPQDYNHPFVSEPHYIFFKLSSHCSVIFVSRRLDRYKVHNSYEYFTVHLLHFNP